MGQGVEIDDNNCIVNKNPATGEVLGRVPCTTKAQVEEMVKRSKAAQTSWALQPAKDRIDLLKQACKSLLPDLEAHIELMVKEMGKPKAEAKGEIEAIIYRDQSEYYDLLLEAQAPKTHGTCIVVRQAHGVVLVISPWNFPMGEIVLLALPALAAGNTVIVKPSEVAPECGAAVVKSFASILPSNVIQLAQGDGTVGRWLVANPSVDLVSMTGSSATGKHILSTSAASLKRVVLELGGKDPMVVFGDASIEKAANDAVAFSLSNTGQVCCSVERVIVAESIREAFEEKVVEVAKTYQVGNGLDDSIQVGPLVSPMQRDHVKMHVDKALEAGANLLYQGDIPDGCGGNFYPVTVLSNLDKDMDVFSFETFGPVVALSTFDGTEEEAIKIANDTEYGLCGSIYTQDLERAGRMATQMDCGQVGVNCYALSHMDVACPWVGHKSSGYGYHSGIEGFHNFSIPKSIVFTSNDDKAKAKV